MSKNPKAKLSWLYNRLDENNFKLTKPRQLILDILRKTPKHLSAEDVYMDVGKSYPAVGLATIYRNLQMLVQIGLVLKFDFGDGKARYELSQNPDGIHHHHLICKNCNKVINYYQSIDEDNEKKFLKRREKKLSKKYNFKIEKHLIDFFGLCRNCSDKG